MEKYFEMFLYSGGVPGTAFESIYAGEDFLVAAKRENLHVYF